MTKMFLNNNFLYREDGKWNLKDWAISQRLAELSVRYDDGEIIETRNELLEIVNAIDVWTEQEEG